MQLRQLDTAAEILEWPLTILRRATIPLLERDCYSRAWFLTSLVTFLTSSFNLPWATSRLTSMHCIRNERCSGQHRFGLEGM